MQELVKGVILRRFNEHIENVLTDKMHLQLVASGDGTELIRQTVPQGARFGLRPDEGWSALECLYIIQGTARWESTATVVTLQAGDSLTGHPVQEPCILQADTDLVALYVCSQPVFHAISAEMVSLMDMAKAVEEKDGYTGDHCERIQQFSMRVAKALGLSPLDQHYLLYGSFLHDLGKVKIPDAVLKKPGRLTPEEWHIMQSHTTLGRDMLRATSLAGAAPMLEQHHERLDGSGYPHGLRGAEIHLGAQIVAVADSFDAMTSNRVYQTARSADEALAEIERSSGRLYHPDVVAAFLSIMTSPTQRR